MSVILEVFIGSGYNIDLPLPTETTDTIPDNNVLLDWFEGSLTGIKNVFLDIFRGSDVLSSPIPITETTPPPPPEEPYIPPITTGYQLVIEQGYDYQITDKQLFMEVFLKDRHRIHIKRKNMKDCIALVFPRWITEAISITAKDYFIEIRKTGDTSNLKGKWFWLAVIKYQNSLDYIRRINRIIEESPEKLIDYLPSSLFIAVFKIHIT